MTVPVHVAPQRRDAVDVRVAVGVVQIGALRVVDHERELLGAPRVLLGERMPEMTAVRGGELGGGAHAPQRSSVAGRNGGLAAYGGLAPDFLSGPSVDRRDARRRD